LTYLLERHYGLTLNDTPFGGDGVIQEYIDAGDSLVDALNEVAEDCDLGRIDNPGKSRLSVSPLLTQADIRNAQNAVGLAGSNTTLIISGQSSSGS
ncbi:TA system toxin CbtA family protein, partial [Enterobacter ludwigii]